MHLQTAFLHLLPVRVRLGRGRIDLRVPAEHADEAAVVVDLAHAVGCRIEAAELVGVDRLQIAEHLVQRLATDRLDVLGIGPFLIAELLDPILAGVEAVAADSQQQAVQRKRQAVLEPADVADGDECLAVLDFQHLGRRVLVGFLDGPNDLVQMLQECLLGLGGIELHLNVGAGPVGLHLTGVELEAVNAEVLLRFRVGIGIDQEVAAQDEVRDACELGLGVAAEERLFGGLRLVNLRHPVIQNGRVLQDFHFQNTLLEVEHLRRYLAGIAEHRRPASEPCPEWSLSTLSTYRYRSPSTKTCGYVPALLMDYRKHGISFLFSLLSCYNYRVTSSLPCGFFPQ